MLRACRRTRRSNSVSVDSQPRGGHGQTDRFEGGQEFLNALRRVLEARAMEPCRPEYVVGSSIDEFADEDVGMLSLNPVLVEVQRARYTSFTATYISRSRSGAG